MKEETLLSTNRCEPRRVGLQKAVSSYVNTSMETVEEKQPKEEEKKVQENDYGVTTNPSSRGS